MRGPRQAGNRGIWTHKELKFLEQMELLNIVVKVQLNQFILEPVLGIRMFSGFPDPDPLVRGKDPDPSLFS
jgi:hypothetical protein